MEREMLAYQVTYYDHNGIQYRTRNTAGSVRGAKQAATQRAAGTTTEIYLSIGGKVFYRRALDLFAGFCRGYGPWREDM
jgi:hypothetical protein